MSVYLWRGWHCVCFSNIQFPAHVKAATADSCPDWGNIVVPLAGWAPQTWPSPFSECRMGQENKTQRNIKTRVSKDVHCGFKNLEWTFFMHALHCWLSLHTSKDWFLTNPFLTNPFLHSPLSPPSTVGGGHSLLPRLKLKGHFYGGLQLCKRKTCFSRMHKAGGGKAPSGTALPALISLKVLQ